MGAFLRDDPAIDDENSVRFQNCRKAMGDDDACSAFHQVVKGILYGIFRDGVKGGGGFVQNQDFGIFQNNTGNGNTLLLTAGKLETAVADFRVVSVGLTHNEIMNAGNLAGVLNFHLSGILFGIKQILSDGAVEKVSFLSDHADAVAQIFQVKGAYVVFADADYSAIYVIETGQQVDHGGFSRTGWADNGIHLPVRYGEIDVGKKRLFRIIGEGDMKVADVQILHIRLITVFRVDNRVDHVKIVENAGEKSKRTGEINLNVKQRLHRPVKAVDKGDCGSDGADFQGGVKTADDEETTGKIDEKRTNLGEHAHDHAKPLAASLLFHGNLRCFFVHTDKFVILLFFPGEEFYQKRPADAERLVDELIHFIIFCLAFREKLEASAADHAGGEDEKRDDENADDGQAPAHGEERNQCGDNGCNIADNVGERGGDDCTDAADVGVHACDDISLLFTGKKGMGHMLEMVEHLVLHIKNDALGNPGIDITLQNTDHLRYGEGGKSEENQLNQITERSAVRTECIHDSAGDDGRIQTDNSGEQNCGKDEQKLQPVGGKIAENTADQIPGDFGHIGLFVFREKSAGSARTETWAGTGHNDFLL